MPRGKSGDQLKAMQDAARESKRRRREQHAIGEQLRPQVGPVAVDAQLLSGQLAARSPNALHPIVDIVGQAVANAMAVRASPSELGRRFLLENVSTDKTPLDKKASAFNMSRRTCDRTTS
ncbi:unnamed protein product, partial [Prorocentrum cordatum]